MGKENANAATGEGGAAEGGVQNNVVLQVDMRSSHRKLSPKEAPVVTSPIATSSSEAGNRE